MPSCLKTRILVCLAAATQALNGAPGRTQLYPAAVPVSSFSLAVDRHGLIWAAAKEGVVRFDGLHYHNIPGYPFRDARFVAFEASGVLWVGGSRGLARYENSQWKAVLHVPVEAMAMGPPGLWVHAGSLRLISRTQAEKRFDGVKPTGELLVDPDGALWFPSGNRICTLRPPEWRLESQIIAAPGSWKRVVPERGGRSYWVSSPEEVALVEDGAERSRQKAKNPPANFDQLSEPLDPFLSPAGTVWGTRLHLRELPGWELWQTGPVVGYCSLFTDEATRWFCAGDKLGKSVRETEWESWAGEAFTSLSVSGFLPRAGRNPLLLSNRGVLDVNEVTSGSPRADAKRDVLNVLDDGRDGYWLATRDEGLLRTGKDFRVLERFPKLCPSIDTIRALLRDGRGRTWVGGKDPNCFFEVRGGPGNWRFIPQNLPETTYQTVELRTDSDGKPWVGYEYGIAYLDDSGDWRRIATSEPVTLIRTLEFDGRDAIWVAHRRPGFFTRLERRRGVWQVRRFPANLYGPAQTMNLRRDSRGWIWRGTPDDVQVARPGRYEPEDWLNLHNLNGLAPLEVSLRGWYEDDTGDVWLGGNAGVNRVHPVPAWFDAPKFRRPIITRVSANGRTCYDPERMPRQLGKVDGSLEIDLSALDANPFRKAPLRYWLAPVDSTWKPSSDGRLRFDRLGNGSYSLEVAYTGEGSPDILRWEFQVEGAGNGYLVPAVGLGALGSVAIWGWRQREWLEYWVRKKVFMFRRTLHQSDGVVPAENYIGRVLNHRYEVSAALSRGGCSVTYVARDRDTGQKVVVKVLYHRPNEERWMRHRFAHEVAALHTLNHPGVVKLLDSWIGLNGEPCLVMPYLEGPTLRQLLNNEGRLDPSRASRIIQQLGAAVGAIHQRGIVHRDLKPENVIVMAVDGPEVQAVVIDFGTSAARGPERDLEATVTLTGSLHYLAPERLAGQYSPASDLYSLGVMALEMVSGKRLADMEVAPAETEFVQTVGQWTGEPAAGTIASALRHQPWLRPADAEAWAADLSRQLLEFSEGRRDGRPSS